MSIMNTDSGSIRIDRPAWKLAPPSQVHAVESTIRSSASRPQSWMKVESAPPNATIVDSAEIHAAVRFEMFMPASVMTSAPASGASRQIQADAIIGSPAEHREPVDVEREALAVDRHDQPEADHDLGSRHRHHGEREDLPVGA